MNTAAPAECLKALAHATKGVDQRLEKILVARSRGPAAEMYSMLAYFLGFLDENLKPASGSGKRLRPGLCLLIAEGYGARSKAFNAALAIELFHNFTLIHDDVEDRDEVRRNRPTVWKLWGINHAINSGDAQSLLVSELALQAGENIAPVLLKAFIEVIEGQYLDFQLAVDPIGGSTVNEKRCELMGGKKTGALIAVAAESAGMAAGQSKNECNRLRAYGMALGMTFQLADDYKSVWSTQKETGKDAQSDIREHKRTLPFFITYAHTKGAVRERLAELYSLNRQLTENEVDEVCAIMDATPAKVEMLERVQHYADSAQKQAWKLSLPEKTRAILAGAASMLVPERK